MTVFTIERDFTDEIHDLIAEGFAIEEASGLRIADGFSDRSIYLCIRQNVGLIGVLRITLATQAESLLSTWTRGVVSNRARTAEISRISVRRSHQGIGLYKLLVVKAMALCKSAGCPMIAMVIDTDFPHLTWLRETMGYKTDGQIYMSYDIEEVPGFPVYHITHDLEPDFEDQFAERVGRFAERGGAICHDSCSAPHFAACL